MTGLLGRQLFIFWGAVQISLLRINDAGRPVSVGDITATVEPEPEVVRLLGDSKPSPACLHGDLERQSAALVFAVLLQKDTFLLLRKATEIVRSKPSG